MFNTKKVIISLLVAVVFFSSGVSNAFAANIIWQDPGTDATGDTSRYAITNTVTSDTGVAHTGSRSLRLNTSSPATTPLAQLNGVMADAGRRVSFWFYKTTNPAAEQSFLQIRPSGSANLMWFSRIEPTGKITNAGTGLTQVIGNAVLANNTWYRISVVYTITNSTTFTFKVYVNGTLDSTLNTGTMTYSTGTDLYFRLSNSTGANQSHYFDDIYIDDGTDLADPGDVRVTAKRPAGNNTNNFDTAVGANPANRWTNVNEIPISTTNGWQHAASTDVQENYTLETASAGDVDLTGATIIGRTAWIYAKGTAGGAGTPKIMDNGTETAVTLTSTAALYEVTTTSATYPSNAAGIGMRSTNNADDTFLYDAGTILSYFPAVASVKTKNGLAWASVKTLYGLVRASVKKVNGLVAQ